MLPNGRIYFEINEQFGVEISELLLKSGFGDVKIVNDLNGKARMVRGAKS